MDTNDLQAGSLPIDPGTWNTLPLDQLAGSIGNAERLLRYAAEEGVAVPPEIVGPIVDARLGFARHGLSKDELMAFFAALTRLAAMLKPVSAASIAACEDTDTPRLLNWDRRRAIIATLLVLILSGIGYVSSSLNAQINEDVAVANKLAAVLRADITTTVNKGDVDAPCEKLTTAGPPISGLQAITDLQQFAATSRDIYKRSLKSDIFVMVWESDPLDAGGRRNLELNPAISNYHAELFCKIELYEKIRDFSRNVVLDGTYFYGAISSYILPVLYALVGAYAFRLRSFSETIRKKTFHPSYADSARITGALIIGAIVSLFNVFTQGTNLPPLAIAFLAGYAVEVFYAFLDTLIKTFQRQEPAPPALRTP